ncbi:MAG: hypothetical protein ACREMP_00555 [Candidatus Tyrphobacter sp.]
MRWEATKIVLASERRLAREEKIMDYRSFVTEKTRAGDTTAQRALDILNAPVRQEHSAMAGEPRVVTVSEVRARLAVIRAEEESRHQRARSERERLTRVGRPPALDEVLMAERHRIEKQVSDATQFTESERRHLDELAAEKRSWNPLTRASAARREASLHGALHTRRAAALADALRQFEERDVPRMAKRISADENQYRQYVNASLALEAEMRDGTSVLRDRMPRVERQLNILERAGMNTFEAYTSSSGATLAQLAFAIEQQYRGLPDAARQQAERSVNRERSHERARDSMEMGGR